MIWLYEGQEFSDPQDYYGFIYCITNLTNNKKYFGKKQFYFKKQRVVKGKKKSYQAESDWKTYFSSSDQVKEDVALLDEDNFKREILRLCNSKAELSYYESKVIFENDALLKPDEYYNGWISCRIRRNHLTKILTFSPQQDILDE